MELVASLPCYLEENVDARREEGVFEKSIAARRKSNAVVTPTDLENWAILKADHCLAQTAGSGSGCTGVVGKFRLE